MKELGVVLEEILYQELILYNPKIHHCIGKNQVTKWNVSPL